MRAKAKFDVAQELSILPLTRLGLHAVNDASLMSALDPRRRAQD